ncbi:MAG: EamA family transporter [Bacillota bacterium]|jgi:transporter family protein|nr:EamA family transporter [Candidatus Fermentithermobacillaceae bacterium]
MSWLAWAVVAAVFWGVGPIFAKLGLEKPDALTALLIRSVAVVAVLIVWVLVRGDFRGSLAEVNGRTWVLLLLEGASASVLAHFAYFKALQAGSITGVVPIAAAYPLISVTLSVILLGSKLSVGKGIGAIVTVLGVYLLQRY